MSHGLCVQKTIEIAIAEERKKEAAMGWPKRLLYRTFKKIQPPIGYWFYILISNPFAIACDFIRKTINGWIYQRKYRILMKEIEADPVIREMWKQATSSIGTIVDEDRGPDSLN